MSELNYGPVLVTKGIHKGKIGVYDDDVPNRVRSAFVVLCDFKGGAEPAYLNPDNLKAVSSVEPTKWNDEDRKLFYGLWHE